MASNSFTAEIEVLNDIVGDLEKQSCTALFIDVSKAFDTFDPAQLKQTILKIDMSDQTV